MPYRIENASAGDRSIISRSIISVGKLRAIGPDEVCPRRRWPTGQVSRILASAYTAIFECLAARRGVFVLGLVVIAAAHAGRHARRGHPCVTRKKPKPAIRIRSPLW